HAVQPGLGLSGTGTAGRGAAVLKAQPGAVAAERFHCPQTVCAAGAVSPALEPTGRSAGRLPDREGAPPQRPGAAVPGGASAARARRPGRGGTVLAAAPGDARTGAFW